MSTNLGASFTIAGLLEILIPLGLGFYVTRRFNTSWKQWFVGALMFLISLIRVPLNGYASQLILQAPITQMTYIYLTLVPSFTAGLFEETARYIGLRYIIKDSSYEKGLTYGVGHGGIESIFLVGLSVLSVGMLLITGSNAIPADQMEVILATPVIMPMVGLYERIMAMIMQIGFSIMVVESLRKGNKYLLAAIALHTFADFLLVSVVSQSILYAEVIATGFALGLGYWTYNRLRDEGIIN